MIRILRHPLDVVLYRSEFIHPPVPMFPLMREQIPFVYRIQLILAQLQVCEQVLKLLEPSRPVRCA